jgi:phosphoribosyl 1,2-cyclic phosphate phosphodiesterase
LRYTPHESHFSVKQAVHWAERLKPKRTILTHMTSELDYDTLKRDLPEGIEPAFDGMQVAFS